MKQIGNLNFSVTDKWNEGFTGSISFGNQADDLKGWTIEFDAPFAIYEIWGGEIVSHSGNHYVIKNDDWNQSLKWGETAKFGFNANNNSSTITNPSNFTFEKQSVPATSSNQYIDLDDGTTDNPIDTVNPDNGSTDSPIDTVNPDNSSTDSPVDTVNTDNGNPNGNGQFRYGEALQKNFLFYEAQRSGDLLKDNRIEWRGDAALNDGSDVGRDLSGGYFDAGDHVKFGFPMAYTMTMMGWSIEEYRNAFAKSGQLDEALEAIKWGTDYFLKCHVTDENGTKEFYGQLGNGSIDHGYWGPSEKMNVSRPSYKIDREHPGSDLAAETAASLAVASIIFRPTDSAYADTLLTNARQLYDFAEKYQGKYSDSITDAQSYYKTNDKGYKDELAWGATWLYKASKNSSYLDKAKEYYQSLAIANNNDSWSTQQWNDKDHGTAVLLAQETNESKYRTNVETWLNVWSDKSGNGIPYTSGGLAWSSYWGSLANSSTTAFLSGLYSDTVTDYEGRYANLAKEQVDYILGDNPNNFSYMIGFGDKYPKEPHHRGASGTTSGDINGVDSAHILYGAMVAGPKSANDYDYEDKRSDYIGNEVAISYNSGLTGALAYMYEHFGGEALSNSELNNLPGIVVSDV